MTAAKIISWVERGFVPESVVRAGIRQLLRERLEEVETSNPERSALNKIEFVRQMKQACIAPLPELANEQHYEVPAQFYRHVLGKHGKYSCCYWPSDYLSLNQAEAEALSKTCENADLKDGQHILELGCGWGSLTLWMARKFPNSTIHAVSNSHSQKAYIDAQAREWGLDNVFVETTDMNDFFTNQRFDRVVSVEMFEHMRNYATLYQRIGTWLEPDGKFFKHIFCHRSEAYEFVDNGPSDWMSRYFFSGGIMPSDDLPLFFQKDLALDSKWRWSGQHYERTSNAWLRNLESNRDLVIPILSDTYGAENAEMWYQRWRVFFMACAELFGYKDGNEWWVSHYLFSKKQ